MGQSTQAMSTFTSLHSLIKGVLNGTSAADVAASVVQQVYDKVKQSSATDASQVRAHQLHAHFPLHCAGWALQLRGFDYCHPHNMLSPCSPASF